MTRRSAGWQYIGGPWIDVVEVGHVLHMEHLLPDMRHYVECCEHDTPVTKFYVNKDAWIGMP